MEESLEQKNVENISEENTKMEEIFGPSEGGADLTEGKIVKAKIVAEIADAFLVGLGLKSEGLIPKSELNGESLTVGAEVSVLLLRMHSADGHPLVSYRQAREQEAWEIINQCNRDAKPIEGAIRKKIKGGFIVDIGIDAFLPASQLDIRMPKETVSYLGQKMQFLITEANRAQNNVVLSRRKILEVEQKDVQKTVLAGLFEGQIIEGIVSGITDFGAFVDIGGVEGLVHIGEIAWYHVKKVNDVLSPGQKVKVKVLKIAREKGKVSLGMKQLIPKPWESASRKYPAGTKVSGIISSITDFGIFVELEPGIEGLLHTSEVSWSDRQEKLKEKFSVGKELEVQVIAIDPQKEKMSLSLKRLAANPWTSLSAKYPKGTRVKGIVTHLTPFGAFVKLPEGFEGLVHVSDMSWIMKVQHPKDVVSEGQETEVVVLDINAANEKISLSIKHLNEDPFKKYNNGKVVSGAVKRITDFGAFVELEPGVEALLRSSEIGPKRPENVSDLLKIGQEVEAKIIKSDPLERKIDISVKKLDNERERELIKKYANKVNKTTLGDLLEEEQ